MADFDIMRKEVNEKIDIMEALYGSLDDNPLKDNIIRDLITPALSFLAQFCECIKEDEDDSNEEIKLSI